MSNNKKIRVLVTGALGHIGSSLIRNLSNQVVEEIHMLDNLESQRYPSLFNLPETFKYKFFEADVRTADLEKYINNSDVVVHLAAITNAEASHGREKEVEEVNLDGLKRVAEACLKLNVKVFFPSTTSVYGSQDSRVDEDCQELRPQSPYAESKLSAENYLKNLGTKGLRFVVCRFGTIFGPAIGMRYHTAVNKFIWQAVTGRPLSVWKTAWKQKRPYLDLRDGIAAINLILTKDIFDGQIYNVLTENFTVEDIVNTIKEFIPSLKVNYVDSPIMNQLSYEVDDSKFKSQGFEVKGDLRQGVSESIELLKRIKE